MNSTILTEDISFDNLYQAILQCFVIILSGYVAGRAGFVSATQGSGIGTFVSKFCLPALLFQNMCKLQFSQVNWMFLIGILISKGSLFFLVGGVSLLVRRPSHLGYAGIFSIFCTQSNDFALGYPIVQALYSETHPEFLQYIYLVAPISLVVLNPIGFIAMEIHKHRIAQEDPGHHAQGMGSAVKNVIKGILFNPIVFMTAIGVLGNFIFSGTVPDVLDKILTIFSQAYNAAALFYLGLSMVGKVQSQFGLSMIVPILLITAKTLILPLITWEVVGWLEPTSNNNSYSMFGFLYGTIPTAPSVFLYASEYGVAQDMVATGLVLGTFLSAPLMFISAKMMTVMVVTGMDYADMLRSASFDVSIISLICCLWVAGVYCVTGKWKRVPHKYTMALIVSNIISCSGMIAFYAHGTEEITSWQHYPISVTLLIGVLATRCWTAIIAVVVCMLHVRTLCFVLKFNMWYYFAGFGIPIFLTGLIFIIGSHDITGEMDPSFHYGFLQTCFSAGVLFISVVITIVSLVYWQRIERGSPRRGSATYNSLQEDQSSGSTEEQTGSDGRASPWGQSADGLPVDEAPALDQGEEYQGPVQRGTLPRVRSLEDIVPRSVSGSYNVNYENTVMEEVSELTCLMGACSTEERYACMERLRAYTAASVINESGTHEEEMLSVKEKARADYQTVRHLILLLLLLLSMFIGLFLCVWRIFNKDASGIYIEIEFLDCVFNYGQGFLILILFGFDNKDFYSPLFRSLRRIFLGAEVVRLPNMTDLDRVTRQTCQQFTAYHKENCSRDIIKDRRLRFRTIKDVFSGTKLCDWLEASGLAPDRDSAVVYGKRLLLGRVLTHITSEQHFYDSRAYYKFVEYQPVD